MASRVAGTSAGPRAGTWRTKTTPNTASVHTKMRSATTQARGIL
jgi:hypothetical protein